MTQHPMAAEAIRPGTSLRHGLHGPLRPAFEPRAGKLWRQVAWKTVGRGEKAEVEARALAIEMERQEAEHGERFLSWHVAGERLPLDRLCRVVPREAPAERRPPTG
jgi:hypothetical protein